MDDLFDRVKMSTLDSIITNTIQPSVKENVDIIFENSLSDVPAHSDSDDEVLLKKSKHVSTEPAVNIPRSLQKEASSPSSFIEESASIKQHAVALESDGERHENTKTIVDTNLPADKWENYTNSTILTKAQQKLCVPNTMERCPIQNTFKIKRCAVRIRKLKLPDSLHEDKRENRNVEDKDSIKSRKRRRHITSDSDKTLSAKKNKSDNHKTNATDNRLKKADNNTKTKRKRDEIKEAIKSTKVVLKRKYGRKGKKQVTKVQTLQYAEGNIVSILTLSESSQRRFFRSFVRVKRCKDIDGSKIQDKLNKSKNLSVSFCDEIKIFGRSLSPEDASDKDSNNIDDSNKSSENSVGFTEDDGVAVARMAMDMPVPLEEIKNESSSSHENNNEHNAPRGRRKKTLLEEKSLSDSYFPPLEKEADDDNDMNKLSRSDENINKSKDERLENAMRSFEEIRKLHFTKVVDSESETLVGMATSDNPAFDELADEHIDEADDEPSVDLLDQPVSKETRITTTNDMKITEEKMAAEKLTTGPNILSTLQIKSDKLDKSENSDSSSSNEADTLSTDNQAKKPDDSNIAINSASNAEVNGLCLQMIGNISETIIAEEQQTTHCAISIADIKSSTHKLCTTIKETDDKEQGTITAAKVNELDVSKVLSDTSDSFQSTLGIVEAPINTNSSSNEMFSEELESIEKRASPATANFNEFSLDGCEANQFTNADANITDEDSDSKSTNLLLKDDFKNNFGDLPLKLIAEDSGDGDNTENPYDDI